MADCAMQAELLLDWLGEITIPRFPSKPCNKSAHVRYWEQAEHSCILSRCSYI